MNALIAPALESDAPSHSCARKRRISFLLQEFIKIIYYFINPTNLIFMLSIIKADKVAIPIIYYPVLNHSDCFIIKLYRFKQ